MQAEAVSQSNSQPLSQPVSQLVSQPASQSVSQSASQPASQSVSQSVSQPASQSVSQPVSQAGSQSVHVADSPVAGLSAADVRHLLHQLLHDSEEPPVGGRGEGRSLCRPLSSPRPQQGQGQCPHPPQPQPPTPHGPPGSVSEVRHSACGVTSSVFTQLFTQPVL